MVMRGSSAIKQAKKESEKSKAAMDAIRVQDLYLKEDGQEADMYFLGSPETEPVVLLYHTIQIKQQGGRIRYYFELCAKSFGKNCQCVFCWAQKNGDTRVGRPQKNAVFSVADARWIHKIPNAEKTAKAGGQFEKFDWYDCSDDDKCKWCKKNKPRVRGGLKKLRLGMTAATSLDGTNDHLAKKCMSCGGAKTVKLLHYLNGKKKLPDLEDVDDPSEWTPVYSCSKCDDPQPASIFTAPITFRRNGTGKTTSYTFIAGEPSTRKPKWVAKIEPIDLSKLTARSPDNMAELLGIDNPFDEDGGGKKLKKKSKGAKEYDEEDEEEEEPFGDDDDEEDEDDEDSEDEEEDEDE